MAKKETQIKRGKLCAAFIDFEKAFDSVDRQLLWRELAKKGISEKFILTLQAMYCGDNACVKVNENTLTDKIEITQGVKQGCILSPLLFILFIDSLMDELTTNNIDAPTMGQVTLPGLLFADDLVILSKTITGLQAGLNILEMFCVDTKLTVNVNKSKIMIFKKGWVFSKHECWTFKGKALENVKNFTYLGVNLSMNVSWTRHKEIVKRKGMLILNEIRRTTMSVPDLDPRVTDKMFHTLLVPAISYGSEIWGIGNNTIFCSLQNRYLKNVLGIAHSSANAGVLWEFGAPSIQTTLTKKAIKYWITIRNAQRNSNVITCYNENQNIGWCAQIKKILEHIGLGEIWELTPTRNDYKTITQRLEDIEKQSIEAKRSEKISLAVQSVGGGQWGRKYYINKLNKTERSGYSWFRLGGWKMRRLRNSENVEGKCPLCGGVEEWTHILLFCQNTENSRKKWLEQGGYENNTRNLYLATQIMRDNRLIVVQLLARFFNCVRKRREAVIMRE